MKIFNHHQMNEPLQNLFGIVYSQTQRTAILCQISNSNQPILQDCLIFVLLRFFYKLLNFQFGVFLKSSGFPKIRNTNREKHPNYHNSLMKDTSNVGTVFETGDQKLKILSRNIGIRRTQNYYQKALNSCVYSITRISKFSRSLQVIHFYIFPHKPMDLVKSQIYIQEARKNFKPYFDLRAFVFYIFTHNFS